jgi:hypothetical protein
LKKKLCSKAGCNNPAWWGGKEPRCKYHPLEKKPSKPLKKSGNRLSPISEKEAARLAKYRPIRDKFLRENPTCLFKGCKGKSTVHHAKGRSGDLLWDVSTFRNLCFLHHQWAEEHPAEAKELGLTETRL